MPKKHSRKHSTDDEWVEIPNNNTHQPTQPTTNTKNTPYKPQEWMNTLDDDIIFSGQSKSQLNAAKGPSNSELLQQQKNDIRISRELNPTVKQTLAQTPQNIKKHSYGDSGSSWRMMKLKRVFEISQNESIPTKQVAMERYSSMEEFEDALAEQEFIESKKPKLSTSTPDIKKKSIVPLSKLKTPMQGSNSASNLSTTSDLSTNASSIPSASIPSSAVGISETITVDKLNKLRAKALKARMLGLAEAEQLEQQYEMQKNQTNSTGTITISNIDSRGNLILVGNSAPENQDSKKETHDKLGNRVNYSQDDISQSISDMVREERIGRTQSYDDVIAQGITRDSGFKDDLDYLDETADKVSQKRSVGDKMKNVVISDFKRSQEAIERCPYCFREDRGPRVQVIAKGTRTYLAFPENIDMLPGHCVIVPYDHVLTFLDCDDDVWTEIRNFQKSLLRMFDTIDQGVIFIEQVINFKSHKHTLIECIPIPSEFHADAPAYFKEGINSSEEEWSTHRKLIDTSEKGIRRSMVKNLPYFHVWFDPNRGFGHVIEDSQKWKEWFGREIIASMLDLSADKWRRPRRPTIIEEKERKTWFEARWRQYDWTRLLK